MLCILCVHGDYNYPVRIQERCKVYTPVLDKAVLRSDNNST